jgi:ABC-type nitrate/sulfonate/bicarbonate transport system ATPase subunit/ABC-type nitrate/sulfonate/bicarbonate transport system permease component
MTRTNSAILVLCIGIAIGVWLLASTLDVYRSFIPTPSSLAQEFWARLADAQLPKDVLASLLRVVVGVMIGTVAAYLLQFASQTLSGDSGRQLVNLLFSPFRYVPIPAILPLTIVLFGVGEKQKVFIVAWAAFFVVNMTMNDAIQTIPRHLVDIACLSGFKRVKFVRFFLMPATYPAIIRGVREAFAIGWACVILAEIVGGSSGLGFSASLGVRRVRPEVIWLHLLVIVLIGFIIDTMFRWSLSYLTPWSEGTNPIVTSPDSHALSKWRSDAIVPCDSVPSVQIAGVDVSVPQGRQLLSNIQFAITAGQIGVVVGPSGCGKSTLLRVLAGLFPHSGEICVAGARVRGPVSDVGIVFQRHNCIPWMRVGEFIDFGRRSDLNGKDLETTPELFRQLSIRALVNDFPSRLSGGEEKRIAIARILLSRKAVWLLDEPLAGLDWAASKFIRGLIRRECVRQRAAAIWVTHDLEEAVEVADKLFVLGNEPSRILFAAELESMSADAKTALVSKLESYFPES